MFATLTERLSQTVRQLTGRGRITEENVRETVRQIRMALLEADVALPVAKAFVERVRDRALGDEVAKSLNPGQVFVKIVHDELVRVLGGDRSEIKQKGRPSVLMLVGLQGAGKTTTAGKLARLLARPGRDGAPADERRIGEMLLASTDVYRPAARDQLRTLAGELGAAYFESPSDDPAEIAAAALAEAKRRGARWLIVDTAGRLHVDAEMMDEARTVHAIVDPSETLFVLDSMVGQDAVNSARAFHEALPLTGVVLTKTDGDARGGAALSVREVTGLPIKLIGTGEKLDGLEPFSPSGFASRILGMGDVVGLVERVEQSVDRDAMEQVAAKIKKGRSLNFNDFKQQLEQIGKMGGLEALLEHMPGGAGAGAAAIPGLDGRAIKRQIALIDSMTRRERLNPALIDGSRKRRIAAGAGATVQDVSRLLKQHKQLVKTMKRASKGGFQRLMGQAMRGPRGFGPRR